MPSIPLASPRSPPPPHGPLVQESRCLQVGLFLVEYTSGPQETHSCILFPCNPDGQTVHSSNLFSPANTSGQPVTFAVWVCRPEIDSPLCLYNFRILISSSVGSPFEATILFFLTSLSSVQFSRSVMSDSLWPHGVQHARLPCPSPTPRTYSNSCPWSQWCHPTILSSVVPFSSCPQSLPASGSFPMSQFFASVAKVLEFQLQHQFFQWIFKTDFL